MRIGDQRGVGALGDRVRVELLHRQRHPVAGVELVVAQARVQRAVMAVSSSDGWCWTIARTARRRSRPRPPRQRLRHAAASQLAQGRLDRLAPLRHLLVGERAVGRAEGEPQGQRLVALADLLAPVDVEQLDRRQQRLAGGADGLLTVAASSSPTTTAMSCSTAGKLDTSRYACSRPSCSTWSRSISKPPPSRRSHPAATSGCSSPPTRCSRSPAITAAERPGCRNGCASGSARHSTWATSSTASSARALKKSAARARCASSGGCLRLEDGEVVALVRGRHLGEPSGASSSGVDERYTWADSNRCDPARPCARLWRAASSRPGSSSGRISSGPR